MAGAWEVFAPPGTAFARQRLELAALDALGLAKGDHGTDVADHAPVMDRAVGADLSDPTGRIIAVSTKPAGGESSGPCGSNAEALPMGVVAAVYGTLGRNRGL